MFGEEIIVCKQELKLDEKRRIKIPSQTKVIASETIGILYSMKQDRLLLCSQTEYETLLKKALFAMEEMKQTNTYNAKYIRYLQRTFFGRICFSEEKTDKSCRISIPQKAIDLLEIQASIYAVGVNTHLELFKDEESYQFSLSHK